MGRGGESAERGQPPRSIAAKPGRPMADPASCCRQGARTHRPAASTVGKGRSSPRGRPAGVPWQPNVPWQSSPPTAALDRTSAVDAGVGAVLAQIAGAAIDVTGTAASLRRQTGAARAVAEAALGRASAGDRAVAATVAIASRTVETTTTWPIGTARATAARGAGAPFDEEVAGA